MKNKIFSILFSGVLFMGVNASAQHLDGYMYGDVSAPTGSEWQSPEKLSLNKELPHAWFFSFQNTEAAKKVLPENSDFFSSLDGNWKFHWSANPDERIKGFENNEPATGKWDEIEVPSAWNVAGIGKDGKCKYGIPVYVNQGGIFYHKVEVGDWRKGVMREPPKTWTTYKYRNEVGQYVRSFNVPANWKKLRVFINFDGVDSFFYLWINGKYVGFSKNSRSLAQFDITKYLVKGANRVAVEVYRCSDGSFLETQDMFRMAGIIRSVYLTATPEIHVGDVVAIPDLDSHYINGALNVKLSVSNQSAKDAKRYSMHCSLYPVELYGDGTSDAPVAKAAVEVGDITKQGKAQCEMQLTVPNVKPWSAEAPWRYVLVGELKDKKGRTVETFSTYTGFRKVEIRDTPARFDEFGKAGRYFYVNGRTVKLKGVNRHETNPERGHAVTREQMEKEVMLMKRANINHVRNSHYPDSPYWYYLCDKYGIYLEDECNIESHLYYYGDASLSHVAEFKAAHVAREMAMVRAEVNHPSIVIWSLGNEAGPGDNFKACYKAIKDFDASRPIQYERNNEIVDMGSNQYPSIAWVRNAVKGDAKLKYPFHISEYGHSMGNATGNLVDYWNAIESTNFFCGGAIWEWVDHGLYNYTPQGKRYIAYGGDFGDYPNDGTFCLDGVMFADLSPKPQYYEVKKVYQNVSVAVNRDLSTGNGRIEVFNKNYFEPAVYDIKWILEEDGHEIAGGTLANIKSIPPRTKFLVPLRLDRSLLKADKEYFVRVRFMLPNDMPWAKKGYVQAEEQLEVKAVEGRESIAKAAAGETPEVVESKIGVKVSGNGFAAEFDDEKGTLRSLVYNGKDIIVPDNGPCVDAFRAPLDNDNWACGSWYENGLNNLKHHAKDRQLYKRKDGSVVISYCVEAQAPHAYKRLGGTSGRIRVEDNGKPFDENDFKFKAMQVWTVYPDGSIELESSVSSNKPSAVLPRLGYVMCVPKALDKYTYYGRGPVNNYNDRKTGQFIGRYESTVDAQFVQYGKPQSMSNNEDVRWCALTDASGAGVVFIAKNTMSTSALAYSEQALDTAAHPYQLPESEKNYLHLDCGVTGIGGNSCGQGGPLAEDVVKATPHAFGFIIRPVNGDADSRASVSTSGETPLLLSRSKTGELSIISQDSDAVIYYSINGKRVREYKDKISLSQGGKVEAWTASAPQLKAVENFTKIDRVPTEVVFASSVEVGEGDASHMTDGNPDTFWHTMYSVTVAKFPHWVDLDAGSVKTIKGLTYLPRQHNRNGRIKDYKVQVSIDGKSWGKVVAQGEFEDTEKEKQVVFSAPIKARYVRFTALSACDGQDFATAAEISILAE